MCIIIIWRCTPRSFNVALRPQRPYKPLGTGAQDGHLDLHTAPELWLCTVIICYCVLSDPHIAHGFSARHYVLLVHGLVYYQCSALCRLAISALCTLAISALCRLAISALCRLAISAVCRLAITSRRFCVLFVPGMVHTVYARHLVIWCNNIPEYCQRLAFLCTRARHYALLVPGTVYYRCMILRYASIRHRALLVLSIAYT